MRRAGDFDKIVTLYRPEVTTSDYGSERRELKPVATLRAYMQYGRGWRTATEGGEVLYAKSIYFTVRPYLAIEETDILEIDGEKYRIIAMESRSHSRELELTTELINE